MARNRKSTGRRTASLKAVKEKVTVSEPQEVAERTIVSLIPALVKLTGPSGTDYVFPKAGSEVKVALEDVDFFLSKKQTRRPCCGAGGSNLAFELVEV